MSYIIPWEDIPSNIDWEKLREQKTDIISIIENNNIPNKQIESLHGVLHLLDSIMDSCGNEIGDKIVFGTDNNLDEDSSEKN